MAEIALKAPQNMQFPQGACKCFRRCKSYVAVYENSTFHGCRLSASSAGTMFRLYNGMCAELHPLQAQVKTPCHVFSSSISVSSASYSNTQSHDRLRGNFLSIEIAKIYNSEA